MSESPQNTAARTSGLTPGGSCREYPAAPTPDATSTLTPPLIPTSPAISPEIGLAAEPRKFGMLLEFPEGGMTVILREFADRIEHTEVQHNVRVTKVEVEPVLVDGNLRARVTAWPSDHPGSRPTDAWDAVL